MSKKNLEAKTQAPKTEAENAKSVKKAKVGKALTITGYVLAVIILIATLYISIITISRTSKKSTLSADPIFGVSFLPVQSGSMEPTFSQGDLIIAKTYDGKAELKEGDIVTFRIYENGQPAYITHRIKEVVDARRIKTMGDAFNIEYNPNNESNQVDAEKWEWTAVENVVAVYRSHVKDVGAVITWLADSTNYFLIVVLPLAVLFILYIVYFVRILLQQKAKKAAEQALASVTADILSDEEKERIAREYLASLQAAKPAAEDEGKTEQADEASAEAPADDNDKNA
ncbi:MAG TPA: signal peptidase I [Eubacteriales bacterium]|jgi:signal peptidase|nr:signal peptidase I [Eubacteriales bacterium]